MSSPARQDRLPARGATAVDFAYGNPHDVGNKCVAARINGEIQALRAPLRNGDMVEIVDGPVARPNRVGLSVRAYRQARSKSAISATMKFDESASSRATAGTGARQFTLRLPV